MTPNQEAKFEVWWQAEGQFCRAGGGDYEKSFAYRAFERAMTLSGQDRVQLNATALWENQAVMALNAELGLGMTQLLTLAQAVQGALVVPCSDAHEASIRYAEGYTKGHDAGWQAAVDHCASLIARQGVKK
jgi:hypothetical protein